MTARRSIRTGIVRGSGADLLEGLCSGRRTVFACCDLQDASPAGGNGAAPPGTAGKGGLP